MSNTNRNSSIAVLFIQFHYHWQINQQSAVHDDYILYRYIWLLYSIISLYMIIVYYIIIYDYCIVLYHYIWLLYSIISLYIYDYRVPSSRENRIESTISVLIPAVLELELLHIPNNDGCCFYRSEIVYDSFRCWLDHWRHQLANPDHMP